MLWQGLSLNEASASSGNFMSLLLPKRQGVGSWIVANMRGRCLCRRHQRHQQHQLHQQLRRHRHARTTCGGVFLTRGVTLLTGPWDLRSLTNLTPTLLLFMTGSTVGRLRARIITKEKKREEYTDIHTAVNLVLFLLLKL